MSCHLTFHALDVQREQLKLERNFFSGMGINCKMRPDGDKSRGRLERDGSAIQRAYVATCVICISGPVRVISTWCDT